MKRSLCRTILLATTAMLLLSPALAVGMAEAELPLARPLISLVQGDVSVRGAATTAWEEAEVGRLLSGGDTVRTGPDSRVELQSASGRMRLYENTELVIPRVVQEEGKQDVRGVELVQGSGIFRIFKRGVTRGFEVKTDQVIAGVKGTVFGVISQDRRSVVAVYRGRVEVTNLTRDPATLTVLTTGRRMTVEEGGGFGEYDTFDPQDVWNLWLQQRTPSLSSRQATDLGEGEELLSCPPVVIPW